MTKPGVTEPIQPVDAEPVPESAEPESAVHSELDSVSSGEVVKPDEPVQSHDTETDKSAHSKRKRVSKSEPQAPDPAEFLALEVERLNQVLAEKEAIISAQTEVVAQEKDRTLRTLAEFENFKRRKEQETEDFKKYSNEKMVTELLIILDSFDRAVDHARQITECDQKSFEEMTNGFFLIQKQFHSVLEKFGLLKIEALNQTFDPNLHQAVSQKSVEGVESSIVVHEYQPGYKLHDRLIRPAMVVVSE